MQVRLKRPTCFCFSRTRGRAEIGSRCASRSPLLRTTQVYDCPFRTPPRRRIIEADIAFLAHAVKASDASSKAFAGHSVRKGVVMHPFARILERTHSRYLVRRAAPHPIAAANIRKGPATAADAVAAQSHQPHLRTPHSWQLCEGAPCDAQALQQRTARRARWKQCVGATLVVAYALLVADWTPLQSPLLLLLLVPLPALVDALPAQLRVDGQDSPY